MTLAVQSALVLDRMLTSHGTTIGITYRLRRDLARQLATAWRLSTRNLHAATDDQGRRPDRAPGWAGATRPDSRPPRPPTGTRRR